MKNDKKFVWFVDAVETRCAIDRFLHAIQFIVLSRGASISVVEAAWFKVAQNVDEDPESSRGTKWIMKSILPVNNRSNWR